MKNKKLIVVTGPTASGKTSLSLKIANWLDTEIISADSKQIYKYLDIGTDKIDLSNQKIKHHLIDIATPDQTFTTAQFVSLAKEKISKLQNEGKIPILCGGTYFYIKAVIDGLSLPKVAPDWEFRKEKEALTAKELFNELKQKDPKRAQNIDSKNKRRLIRALEIIEKTENPVPELKSDRLDYPVLILAPKKEKGELHKKQEERIDQMISEGLEKEAKLVIEKFPKIAQETIGYKEWIDYFEDKKDLEAVVSQIKTDTKQFAKRQNTWLKKESRIIWVNNFNDAKKEIKKYL